MEEALKLLVLTLLEYVVLLMVVMQQAVIVRVMLNPNYWRNNLFHDQMITSQKMVAVAVSLETNLCVADDQNEKKRLN